MEESQRKLNFSRVKLALAAFTFLLCFSPLDALAIPVCTDWEESDTIGCRLEYATCIRRRYCCNYLPLAGLVCFKQVRESCHFTVEDCNAGDTFIPFHPETAL